MERFPLKTRFQFAIAIFEMIEQIIKLPNNIKAGFILLNFFSAKI